MAGETPSYNLAATRQLLLVAFTPEDLSSHNGMGQMLVSGRQSVQAMPTSSLRPEEEGGFGGLTGTASRLIFVVHRALPA